MSFSDDGIPDMEEQSEESAMLLASMRHRIGALDGKLEISNVAGVSALTVWVPLHRGPVAV